MALNTLLPLPQITGRTTRTLTASGYVVDDVDPFCLSAAQLADIQLRGQASDWASVLLPQYRAQTWWAPSGLYRSNATETAAGTALVLLGSSDASLSAGAAAGTEAIFAGEFSNPVFDAGGRLTAWTKNGVAHTGVWVDNLNGTHTGTLANSTGASPRIVIVNSTTNRLMAITQ